MTQETVQYARKSLLTKSLKVNREYTEEHLHMLAKKRKKGHFLRLFSKIPKVKQTLPDTILLLSFS